MEQNLMAPSAIKSKLFTFKNKDESPPKQRY